MQPPIFPTVAADPAVTAQLGTNPTRLYPFGEAGEHEPRPYAVWQIVGGQPENYLNTRPDLDSYTIQIDVYGDEIGSTLAAANALRNAIEPHAYIVRWGQQGREDDVGLYRISFDVDWSVHR